MSKKYEEIIMTFCKVYDLRLSCSMFSDKHRVMILDSMYGLCQFLKVNSFGYTISFMSCYDSSISKEDACKKLVNMILESYGFLHIFLTLDGKIADKKIPLSNLNTLEELLMHLDLESGGTIQ